MKPCDHEDDDLVVGEHMITCVGCGKVWRSTPVYFMVDPTTCVHPDDVTYVYEQEPSTSGNVQTRWIS